MKSELVSSVNRLVAEQAMVWPRLAKGLEGLRQSKTRLEHAGGRKILVRHIPHRIKSTTAAVDAASISSRACFLCPENLDAQERGIKFGSDFTIYCNPFPILEQHLTIVHREHRPQRIAGHIGSMIELAEALSNSFVIYNGPACGASAPDHLHFQSCSRDIFPIDQDIRGHEGPVIRNFSPRMFLLRERAAAPLSKNLESLIGQLAEVTHHVPEPMVNIAMFVEDGSFTALVFPRGKHRPSVFETGEFTVSPATIDLCGVFVVPVKQDFERLGSADIEGILEEVTLPQVLFQNVLDRKELWS